MTDEHVLTEEEANIFEPARADDCQRCVQNSVNDTKSRSMPKSVESPAAAIQRRIIEQRIEQILDEIFQLNKLREQLSEMPETTVLQHLIDVEKRICVRQVSRWKKTWQQNSKKYESKLKQKRNNIQMKYTHMLLLELMLMLLLFLELVSPEAAAEEAAPAAASVSILCQFGFMFVSALFHISLNFVAIFCPCAGAVA